MRTAAHWKVRPLTILRGEDRDGWSRVDSILAHAHTLAEQMVCPGCGQPKHEAYNPDSEGWYVVEDTICQGCAAVSRDADIHKEHQTERKVFVVDERPPDVKLKPMPERKRGA